MHYMSVCIIIYVADIFLKIGFIISWKVQITLYIICNKYQCFSSKAFFARPRDEN